jgi:hypothetical protein
MFGKLRPGLSAIDIASSTIARRSEVCKSGDVFAYGPNVDVMQMEVLRAQEFPLMLRRQ